MASKTFVHVREMFAGFFPDAKNHAADHAAFRIKQIESECKTVEQLVRRLSQEKQIIQHDIDNFETKEYYCCANDEPIIFLIYCSRIFCNNRDEEQAIRDGLMLSESYRQTNDRFIKAKRQLPPFLSAHFHANKKNVIFYELDDQPDSTPEKDYLEMRLWQTHQKVNCSTFQFQKLKQNFASSIQKGEVQTEELQKEINQLEKILDNVLNWTADQLFDELFKLKATKDLALAQEKQSFHHLLCSCIKGEKLNYLLNPKFFDNATFDINQGNLSSPPVFFLALLMYGRWLCDVYSGIEEISEGGETLWDDLFFQTFHSGLELGKCAIDKFRNKKRKRGINAEEYFKELKQECRRQYHLYKALAYPHYFCQLTQKEKLKDSFINDCLNSVNIELPVMGLQKAIEINEVVGYLLDEIIINEENARDTTDELPFNRDQMVELFCYLAPDTKLLKQLLEMLAKISECCHNEQIPLCFINEELHDSYKVLIKKAEKIYNKTLGFMDTDSRGYFLSGQLRSLKHMGRFYNMEESSLHWFFKYIKQIQKDELKIAKKMHSFHPAEYNDNNNKKEKTLNKPFNFGYRKGPKELKPILTAMDLKMGMLANGSTVDDLMDVLTCLDLSKNTKTIYIGFTIIKFAYFRKKVEQWFSSFTAANIERSGIFISSTEGPIKAHVLYNSTAILWEDSHLIDSIFDAKY